jgi:hypothetical protein
MHNATQYMNTPSGDSHVLTWFLTFIRIAQETIGTKTNVSAIHKLYPKTDAYISLFMVEGCIRMIEHHPEDSYGEYPNLPVKASHRVSSRGIP